MGLDAAGHYRRRQSRASTDAPATGRARAAGALDLLRRGRNTQGAGRRYPASGNGASLARTGQDGIGHIRTWQGWVAGGIACHVGPRRSGHAGSNAVTAPKLQPVRLVHDAVLICFEATLIHLVGTLVLGVNPEQMLRWIVTAAVV